MKKKEYYEYDPETNKIEPLKSSFKLAWGKLDKWAMFKSIVGMAASGCASIVISKYLKANMPETDNIFDKAVMGVGTYFLTGVVGSAVAKHAEKDLDELKDIFTIVEEVQDDGNVEQA